MASTRTTAPGQSHWALTSLLLAIAAISLSVAIAVSIDATRSREVPGPAPRSQSVSVQLRTWRREAVPSTIEAKMQR